MLGRIGSSQMVRNFLNDLGNNQVALAKYQHQYSTGKKVDSPGDDPVGVGIALNIRTDIDAVESWRKNTYDSLEWLSATDTALGSAGEIIQKARELAVRGANGTLSPDARNAIAAEIDQLSQAYAEVGNAQMGGYYLFGGTAVNTAPFVSTTLPPTASGAYNTGLLTREIGQGQTFSVNTTADRFIDPPGATPDMFVTLSNLANDLRTGNITNVSNQALTRLDAHLTNNLSLRGEVGAKVNRMEMTLSRFDIDDIARRETLSKIEDADMAKVTMDLMTQESVLKSSLAVGARIIQPSLVDFLR